MADIVIANPDGDDLSKWDDDDLIRQLRELVVKTVDLVLKAAATWQELERRGHDLAPLRTGLLAYVARVAAGTVAAETVAAFLGHPAIWPVSTLPLDRQRELASGEGVPLVVRTGNPSEPFTERRAAVGSLTADQVRQVFYRGAVRSVPEQINYLESPGRPKAPDVSKVYGKVQVDKPAGVVRIGRSVADIRDVLAALRETGII